MKRVEQDLFTKYRFVTSLKGEAGGQLAYIQKQADVKQNTYTADLWLLYGARPTQLTTGAQVQAFWWQEGDILFSALRQKQDKDYAKTLPLTVLHRISTTRPGEAVEYLRLKYAVSELVPLDEGRFLFTARWSPLIEKALEQAGGDEDKATELLKEQQDYEVLDEMPFWENGSGFVQGARERLYLYDDGKVSALTGEDTQVEQLRLSHNGDYAYYISTAWPAGGNMPYENILVRLDLASMEHTPVPVQAQGYMHLAYAPLATGDVMAYGTDTLGYGINQNGGFYLIDGQDQSVQLLESSGQYCYYDSVNSDVKLAVAPLWQPDGDGVYFITTLGASSHLMRIDSTGEVRQITAPEGAVMEAALAGGELYFTAMRTQAGPELYHMYDDGVEQPVTNLNGWIADEYDIAAPLPLSFTNSEGAVIEGWVLPPAEYNPDESYPCILTVHGGPKTVYGTVMHHELQYWRALGFGVLFCNPTGGDGRGDEFADIRARYGLIDYDDLMAFVDTALEAHTWIDAARLGVAGGSYGGWMTNWIIGHTDRFRAAVSQRGISSWFSMATVSDIGYYFVPDQTGADPWHSPEALWEQSPLRYANKVSTPTLFIHSEEDYRCPLCEGLQMYGALKINGVKTRLCLFRGENHELSRSGKPKHRLRRLEEIASWFLENL